MPGQLLAVPWASAPCRADVLWAGSAPGRRVPAACWSSAAGPTRYPHPAALQIPGNQVWKPRAARRALTRAQRHRGQDPGARSVCSAFRAAGAGEVWSSRRARSRTPGSGSPQRPGALPVHPESPEPPLSLAAPKDRPGDGVSRGHRERERASGRVCLRRGSPARHSVASAGAESTRAQKGPDGGRPAPPAALGLLRKQAELRAPPWPGSPAPRPHLAPRSQPPAPSPLLAPPAPFLRPACFYHFSLWAIPGRPAAPCI